MHHLIKNKKKNICIIGLMGSGKSIIGKDLSKYLNLKFYDTDKEIEIKTKKSVNEIPIKKPKYTIFFAISFPKDLFAKSVIKNAIG